MKLLPFPIGPSYLAWGFALLFSLVSLGRVHAQPTIVSTVPPTGASGVSLSATLVITFSEVMSNTTTVYLVDSITYDVLPASLAWGTGNTVLTCTPISAVAGEPDDSGGTCRMAKTSRATRWAGCTGGTFTTSLRRAR